MAPPQEEEKKIQLKAQCLCKSETITTSISPSSLPLRGTSCHCTSCRHLTGALRSSDAIWPSIVPRDSLKYYPFSPKTGVLFCGTCSSPMFWEDRPFPDASPEETTYRVFTGVLSKEMEEGKKPLVKWEHHMFVADTIDGGATCWLRRMGQADDIQMWMGGIGGSEEITEQKPWPAIDSLPAARGEGVKGDVKLRCHCGGVDLVLRAGEAQKEFSDFAKNKKEGETMPWFVDPVAPHKFLAVQDACDSCRIWSGGELWTWTFSFLKHLSFTSGEGLPGDTTELRKAVEEKDPRMGTLGVYASSADVQRYHCTRCSASVFYAVDSRPDLVDFAVGLLHSPDGGARAESLLSWSWGDQIGLRQDMLGTWREGLLLDAEMEAEEWRAKRGYPVRWAKVAKRKPSAGNS
ncbi:hypothetical protein QBC35DRAFT_376106 [Podospora australis]|uniref:CENP-V/GFA domain-containing protein n=1 Tax=Podospora australis TaxID=1536484 RepID=A0AAN6WZJ7_9PEZI|nr:hypothetical protein QBC35DRAFT_376106 [Podospora australis]